ncbi:hypothetical protein INT47_006668 [Mucor saturninus]|uniref:Uncharacterized protein n=1 Tax=Mucor saturninus TaxID=64648 RepID=A0A8H7QSS8_9FUNG|nr:hypothetical protein INT47_006668 [Mucor saturninus]
MYFENHPLPTWNLKDAFIDYYIQNDEDFEKTNRAIKKDLEELSKKVTTLKSVRKSAEKYLSRWEKLVVQFREFSKKFKEPTSQLTGQQIKSLQMKDKLFPKNPGPSNNPSNIPSNIKKRKNSQVHSLEREFLFEKVDADQFRSDEKSWVIDGDDVGKKFQQYQIAVAEHVQSGELLVETHIQELLALSNILLIKPDQSSSLFNKYLHTTALIEKEIKAKFNVEKYRFDPIKKANLEGILADLRDKSISIKVASKKIGNILSDEDDDDMDPLLLGVRNLIESIPQSKFNYPVRESSLSCSYVHCVVNPMFNLPELKKHVIWLNTQIIKESNKQSDFIGSTIFGSQLKGPGIIGEVKGEDRKDDKHPCLLDMVRIEVLSGESINQNSYDGVIGILAIGLQTTFFITSLMAPGCYVMLEICSITLPKDFTEIRSYVANMDDLLPVLHYYPSCSNHSDDDFLQTNKRSMMDSSMFEIVANSGKSRKRLCNIVYSH